MGTMSLVHRYYDPVTSQFLSVDPLADVTGTPYAFTGGDPVNGSDPAGLSGDAKAIETYNQEHSCKGRYAHAQGCGQRWYQSGSLPTTVDVASIALCVGTGIGCVAGAGLSTTAHELHDMVNHCSASTKAADGFFGVFSICLAGVSRIGERAIEDLIGARSVFRAHQAVPGALASNATSC
jgi:uncharacterized protein RhaS with RHS repeats